MRTVSYRLADLNRAVISIGKVAENEATQVRFDAAQIFAEYPAAVPALSVMNPAGTAYPAVVTKDGDYVLWTVADSDLTVQGQGEFQLTFTVDGVAVKSCIGRTRIDRSIVADGEAPEPVQNWIDRAQDVLEEVEDAFPTGGTTGQVLAKKSDADRDTEWVDQAGGASGIVNEITTPADVMNVKDAAAGNVSGLVLTVLPIQAGSGDPSPDNVRAISGRSSVVVKQGGKNLVDMSFVSDASSGAKYHTITLRPNTTYTMSSNDPTKNNAGITDLFFCEMNEEVNSGNNGVWLNHPKTRTTNGNGQLRIGYRCNDSWITPAQLEAYETQIEVGSSASSYEQYREIATHTASIPTPPETVYGGEIDWVNGKLKVTMALVSKKYSELNNGSGTTPEGYSIKSIDITSVLADYSIATSAVCNVAKYNASSNAQNVFRITSTGKYIYLTLPTSMDADAIVNVCYPLATPIEYDLTGLDSIALIKGKNNLWIDSGKIKSIEYNADTKLYIDTRIAELQALILDS